MERSAVCGGGEVDGRVERSRARGGGARSRRTRERRRREDPSHASASALLAENHELIAEAERQAKQAEALEIRVAELVTRAEAAESAAAMRRTCVRRITTSPSSTAKVCDASKRARGSAKTRRSRRRVRRRRQGARGDRTTARRRPLGISGDVRVREDGVRGDALRARRSRRGDDDADAGETLEGARRRRGKLRRIFVVPAPGADVTVALAAALAAKESMSAALEAAEPRRRRLAREATRANAAAKAAELEAGGALLAESRRADPPSSATSVTPCE